MKRKHKPERIAALAKRQGRRRYKAQVRGVRKRKRNPSFYIHAQKHGRGPVMLYNGKSFSNTPDSHPHPFATQAQAVAKATRLLSQHKVLHSYKIWVTSRFFGESHVRVNPQHRQQALDLAAQKLEDFSGHEATHVRRVSSRSADKTGFVFGRLPYIDYVATRDGKTDTYRHKFRKRSRPLLAASTDGKQLHIVGGRYEVTEAGIEDR